MRVLSLLALLLVPLAFIVACPPSGEGEGEEGEGEEGEGEEGEGEEGEGEEVEFVVSSDAFVEGGAIPVLHSCDGANTSPALAWSGAPAGTAGFGVVLTDLSINFVHSALWDVAAATTSLPAAVENEASPASVAGALQAVAYDGVTRGYLGPCPPEAHTYEFKLYAVGARPLDGVNVDSSRTAVKAALEAAALATTTITGVYTP